MTEPRGAVLGLSYGFHDAAAALVVDGVAVAAAEQERFSRRKHDRGFPGDAAAACLAAAGLDASEVTDVVYYEKPLVLMARYLAGRQRQGPAGVPSFVRDAPELLRHNLGLGLEVGRWFVDRGVRRPPRLRFVEHHRSHAAAAYFPSPFDHAAILTVDGIGEWSTATVGLGSGSRIDLIEELRYPDSLGLLYSFVTAWCGFEPNDGEYKLMGLAPYGTPTFLDELLALAPRHHDGSVRVDARRLQWYGGRAFRSKDLADRLGGPPREAGAPLTRREADLAASMQAYTEAAVLAMAEHAHQLTGAPSLCLAGGVALNCVANGRVLREGPFDDLWVQPAAGDAGSALGAALSWWHEVVRGPRHRGPDSTDAMSGARLGPRLGDVAAQLDELGVESTQCGDEELVSLVADRLTAGAVVGWADGRMEFGPRALGGRSILADPRDPSVHRRVNLMVKGRESFRPFAPAVLADRAAEWFDVDRPSPYMLFVVPVHADRLVPIDVDEHDLSFEERASVVRSQIPACTHVDGSARVQTVDPAVHPRFAALIEAFAERTGCPVLLNTSFNVAGEPIVASVADAVATAARSGLDLLVLDGHVVERAALDRVGDAALGADDPDGAVESGGAEATKRERVGR